jgi:hypothetical protein
VRQPFSIRVDQATELEVAVTRGVPTEITLELPAGTRADAVPLEIVEPGGEVVQRDSAWRRVGDHELRTALREGVHTVRVTDGPLAGGGSFEVRAPGPTLVRVVLRPR